MNNNVKTLAAQLIKMPIVVVPVKSVELKSNISGAILFLFFGLIGCMILAGSFKAKENNVLYFMIGLLLLATPYLIYLLVSKTKGKMIAQMDQQGITIKNGKVFKWESLKGLTSHLAMRQHGGGQIPHQCYMLDFHFGEGDARASFMMREFMEILYIADSFDVPKKEKTNAYR
jgi:hypothetical protein